MLLHFNTWIPGTNASIKCEKKKKKGGGESRPGHLGYLDLFVDLLWEDKLK